MKPILFLLAFTSTAALAQIQGWVDRYNERGFYDGLSSSTQDSISQEETRAMAVDDSGNVYVTGSSTLTIHAGWKFVTVKYDRTGNRQWAAFYENPNWSTTGASLGQIQPWDIAVDKSGNVYVAGSAPNPDATNIDYVTIKYDPAGNQLWAAKYNGPGNSADIASKIAIDPSGNVIVAGTSTGAGTGVDYAIVKYDMNGNEVWVNRYDGDSHRGDQLIALALDAAGDVYVTGLSDSSGRSLDFATIKYDAGGNKLWSAVYNGSGNYMDVPSAMVLDAAGNAYITGFSEVVKSDTLYGPDSLGNIVPRIVTSPPEEDMTTIKYDADGHQVWLKTYRGNTPVTGSASGSRLALDGSGHLYVLGSTGGTVQYPIVKYDLDGNELGVSTPQNYIGSLYLLGVDGVGNVYASGQGTADIGQTAFSGQYATLMFDPQGTQIWDARYNTPAVDNHGGTLDAEYPVAMAVNPSGSVYVTGLSYNWQTGLDIATVMYSAPLLASQQVGAAGFALNAVDFVDEHTGWTVGNKGTILRSTDAGLSWSAPTLSVTTKDLTSVSFADANTGFAVGKKGTILKTSDGGATWRSLLNGSALWTRADLLHVVGVDGNTGIITGKRGVLLTTSDGGASWSVTVQRAVRTMNDVAFLDRNNGWAVGNKGAISRTTDGGGSWARIAYNNKRITTSALNRVSFSDPLHGWAVGSNVLLSTTDGGSSWTRYPLAKKTSISKIHLNRYGTGAAVGTTGSVTFLQPGGVIKMAVRTTAQSLNDICFINAATACAAGSDGSILRLAFGQPAVKMNIPDPPVEVPIHFALSQNYPNPFNPATVIEYSLPEASRVTLKIYNILGQEVSTLVDELSDAGEASVEWDAREFSSGLYFYRLDATSAADPAKRFSLVRKMVLLK